MDLEAEKRFHHLLEQALDLEGEAVADYLAQQCGDDAELRARLEEALETVDESLLRQGPDVEQVALEELAFGVPPQDFEEGPLTIGPYRLVELLGSGGMGRVFLAEQQRPLRRRVALKLLKTSLAGNEARIRFQAEQQALARLDHPNVGRILEAGATEDGTPFFAMELVSGEPLIRYCDRHRLDLRQRLRLMIAVCRGVEHAHRKQVLHRDLKPSNILVSEVDGKAVPKIIDFGIAKALDQPLTDATLATGGFLGTPTYMSPEALDGSRDLDTRADVYSLGVLLYELLTGVKPYDSESQGGGFASLVLQIRQQKTPRPSTRWGQLPETTRQSLATARQLSMAELERRLKHELDWVVLRAMAKQREERYGSAAALAEDLERYLSFEPLSAGPPSFSYHFRKLLRRHRLAIGLSLGALLLAAGAVGYHLRSRQLISDRTAALTREVERIEWVQRVAYQLPAADRRAEQGLILQAMERIESTMRALQGLGRGAGRYALGRGAQALQHHEEAYGHLQEAWRMGYRTPEVQVSFGLVLSDLYEERLERIFNLPNAAARRLARRQAGDELRDPAISMLSGGRSSNIVVPSLLEAHITLLQVDRRNDQPEAVPDDAAASSRETDRRQLEKTLSLAEDALEERPWLYEAHFLRARAFERLSRLATNDSDFDTAEDFLSRAEAAIEEGLVIGRSDPNGYLRLCRARQSHLTFLVRYLRPGVDALHQQTLEACAMVRRIDPDAVEVELEEARAWLNLMDVEVWDRNEDPSTSLRQMQTRLDRYLKARPESAMARLASARGQMLMSIYRQRNGEDPLSAMDRAIALLREALQLEPNEPTLHIYSAQVLADRANYEMNRGGDPLPDLAAAEHYGRAAVAAVPDDLSSHLYLAGVFLRRSQYRMERGQDPSADLAAGRQWLQRMMEAWPDNLAAPNTMANFYMLEGIWQGKQGEPYGESFERAVDYASRSLEIKPTAPYTLFTRGQSKMWAAFFAASEGQSFAPMAAASRADFAAGLAILPNLPGPHIELSFLALAEARHALASGKTPVERLELAQRGAERALEIDARRADAQRVLAEAELLRAAWQHSRGRNPGFSLEQARRWAEKALEMEPGDAENHLALARWAWRHLQASAVLESGILSLGLEHCESALAIDPTATDGHVLRGALLMQDPQRREEGRKTVEAALAANPSLSFRWRHLLS